jgi:hypothetical protein
MGIDRLMLPTSKLDVPTSSRLRMDERFGASSTSSKVNPGSARNFITILL